MLSTTVEIFVLLGGPQIKGGGGLFCADVLISSFLLQTTKDQRLILNHFTVLPHAVLFKNNLAE